MIALCDHAKVITRLSGRGGSLWARRETKRMSRGDDAMPDQHAERMSYSDRNEPFAHMLFFELADTSKAAVDKFIYDCFEYLSGYKGQTHFSVGTRALQIRRGVSATNFDIAVNMIFENYAAYEKYRDDERHQEFTTEVAGMSPDWIVYDSFLREGRRKKKTTGKK